MKTEHREQTVPAEQQAALDFLQQLYGADAPGHLVIWTLEGERSHWFPANDLEAVARRAVGLADTCNVYFGIGLHPQALGSGKRGKAEGVIAIPGLWLDIDIKGEAHKGDKLPPDLGAALELLDECGPPPSVVVNSGHGLHAWWLFAEPWVFANADERKAAQELVRRFQRQFQERAVKRGWRIDSTPDLARVLRLPGTMNRKLEPVPVQIVGGEFARYTPEQLRPRLAQVSTNGAKPKKAQEQPVAQEFPPACIEPILEGCAWLRHCRDDAATLPEPEWYGALSIIGRCEDGERLAHDFSKPHPGYDHEETAEKLEHARNGAGPRTCANIRHELNGAEFCDGCPSWGKITSPIQLGLTRSPRHEQEHERRAVGELLGDVSRTLRQKGPDAAKSLLVERAGRLQEQERHQKAEPIRSLAEELQAHEERLARWRGSDLLGLPQRSLPALDVATLGLRGLMLLAAAPNVGKTALAVQLGMDVVANNPDACFLFLSLEMSRWDILTRIKCWRAGMDWKTLVFGSEPGRGRGGAAFYGAAEWQRLQETEADLKELGQRIRILDERNFPAPTVGKVLVQLDELKKTSGAARAFLLVDYLQVWPTPEGEAARNIRSELDADKWRVGAMKQLRDALDGDPVLVISEARKPGASGTTWGGELADIMGSARGTYTPDMVFLFRPLTSDPELNGLDLGDAEAIRERMREHGVSFNKLTIAKGRDGVTRTDFDLTFQWRRSRFVEGFRLDDED